MRVIIAGIGAMGEELLAELAARAGYEVVAIDHDSERCSELADRYDALVINGDAANPEILEKAQLDRADGVIACTGADAINTIVAMLAHRAGVERIVVKIVTNALRSALSEIGVSEIITPTLAAAAKAQAALHGSDHADLAELVQGGLRLADATVPSGAGGRCVGDLDLPDGVLAVALLRGDETQVPNTATRLEDEDVLLLLGEDSDRLEKARRAVEG